MAGAPCRIDQLDHHPRQPGGGTAPGGGHGTDLSPPPSGLGGDRLHGRARCMCWRFWPKERGEALWSELENQPGAKVTKKD